jgi:extracellular factor (EF) 3-hydroxypalmitic acid methyl ester biosynthesis protein
VQELIRNAPIANDADFTLVDFNQETLDHAERQLNALKRTYGCRAGVKAQRMSVQQLIIRAQKGKPMDLIRFDMVYCAGLFDYLSEGTCRALLRLFWDSLRPEGLAVVANMDDSKPFRNFIEFVLDWRLIYRKSADLLAFCSPEIVEFARTVAELTSVNVFLHVRKPQ